MGNHGRNLSRKRIYEPVPSSPSGVIDAYLSSDSSNDSWSVAPEPQLKRKRVEDQSHMRLASLSTVFVGLAKDPHWYRFIIYYLQSIFIDTLGLFSFITIQFNYAASTLFFCCDGLEMLAPFDWGNGEWDLASVDLLLPMKNIFQDYSFDLYNDVASLHVSTLIMPLPRLDGVYAFQLWTGWQWTLCSFFFLFLFFIELKCGEMSWYQQQIVLVDFSYLVFLYLRSLTSLSISILYY